MKVAFFFEIFYPQINGVVISTVNLALNLQRLGHQVLFFAPRTGTFAEPRVHGSIETYYVDAVPFKAYPGMGVTLPWSHKVVGRIRREGVDVLHFTGPFTLGLNAINASRQLDIPLVQTFHTLVQESSYMKYVTKMDLPHGQLLTWQYVGLYLRACDVITCPSRYVLAEVKRRFPRFRYAHINNGIDLDDFRRADSREELMLRYPQFNRKTFLFVGRHGPEKSIDILLRALAQAVRQDPEIRLLLVGDGPDSEALRLLAQELGLAGKAFFLGKISHDELLESGLIHHARAFVTASKTEIQSMTVLEAVACGTPLVLAEVEAMMEIIDGNGLYFPPDDVGEMARCMVRLAADDELAATFRGRTGALVDRYDGRHVAQEFESLYRSLL